MSALQPSGTLKQPPIMNSGFSSYLRRREISSHPDRRSPYGSVSSSSSSSSLAGLELSVPSFQSFVTRTSSSPESFPNKPLPQMPMTWEDPGDANADLKPRRTSSVYSRTPSQVYPEQQNLWKSAKCNSVLRQSMQYSMSTPNFSRQGEQRPFLESATSSPPINSPLRTMRGTATNSDSALPSPTSPSSTDLPFRSSKARTISLEQAERAKNAAGAVHFLPEELRALKKVKSKSNMQRAGIGRQDGKENVSQLTALPPMLDVLNHENNNPTLSGLQSECLAVGGATNRLDATYLVTLPVKPEIPRTKLLPLGENLELRPNHFHETGRGKTLPVVLPQRLSSRFANVSGKKDGSDLAMEYRYLIGQTPGQQFSIRGYGSHESTKAHTNVFPKPLIQEKKPFRANKLNDASSNGISSAFLPRISLGSPPKRTKKASQHSATGTIQISPPADLGSKQGGLPPIVTNLRKQLREAKVHKRKKVPSYYHSRVTLRRSVRHGRDRKQYSKPNANLHRRDNSLLAKTTVSSRNETPDVEWITSGWPSETTMTAWSEEESFLGENSKSSKRWLLYRFTKSMGRRRRKGSIRESSPEREKSPWASVQASPASPHLLPSPTATRKRAQHAHLGWSSSAKRIFDEATTPPAISPAASPPPPPPPPMMTTKTKPTHLHITHVAAPAKPLDDRKAGLSEPETSPSGSWRRPVLFANMLDNWRENKAQRKREDLKKLIRIAPSPGISAQSDAGTRGPLPLSPQTTTNTATAAPAEVQGSSLLPAMVLPRRTSAYGWL